MVNTGHLGKSSLAVATAAIIATQSGFSSAQDVRLEEVVVSARKISENVQDIPLAISVLGATEIDQLGITNTEDVIKYNPGMTLTQGIGGQDIRPDIRGVTSLSGRANVAILVDGVDQTSDSLTGAGGGQLIGLELYDLERIEVVRGPQSALYGRNAFAGAINYVTKRPSETFEGELAADAGSDDYLKGRLSLSGPITDTLAYRLTGTHKEVDGQYDHPVTGKNLGDEDSDAVSLSLEWAASDRLNFLARVDWANQKIGERPVTISPYNACTSLDDDGNEVRTEGVCELIPFEQSPTSIGELDATDEDDIRLSAEGTDGISNDLYSFNLQTEWDADNYTVTSNTAYTHVESDDNYDLDLQETVTSLPTGTPTGAPSFVQVPSLSLISFPWVDENNPFRYEYDAENERDVFFQDLRVSFSTGDDIDWLVGAEYYYEDYTQKDYLRANGAISRNELSTTASVTTELWSDITVPDGGVPIQSSISEMLELTGTLPDEAERETNAYGIYAAMKWRFAEAWELSLSARYQEEDIDIEYTTIDANYATPMFQDQKPGILYPSLLQPIGSDCTTGPVSDPVFFPTIGQLCSLSATGEPLNTGPRTIKKDETFDAFNPRASLTWYYNDDHMFYGSVAKGTKPGGFNFESTLIDSNVVYDQEELITYELGWKGQWWDNRIQFNGAIYYNDNSDKQASANQPAMDGDPPVPFVDNIGDAESYGLELNNTVLLSDNWRLNLSYSYIQAEYKDFKRTRSDGASVVDLSGQDLPRTPDHSALASLEYRRPVGDSEIFVRGDVFYRDEMYADDIGWTTLPDTTTADIQIGWMAEKWEVIGYVNNVTDEDDMLNAISFVDFQQQFQNIYTGTPAIKRNGGIRARYRF